MNDLKVGDLLYGFCEGAFGRDSYGDKTIDGIGKNWVVALDETLGPVFARVDPATLIKFRSSEPDPDEAPPAPVKPKFGRGVPVRPLVTPHRPRIVFQAAYSGFCQAGGDWIDEGDEITSDDDGWSHVGCL